VLDLANQLAREVHVELLFLSLRRHLLES
jgi:hypothetical protein